MSFERFGATNSEEQATSLHPGKIDIDEMAGFPEANTTPEEPIEKEPVLDVQDFLYELDLAPLVDQKLNDDEARHFLRTEIDNLRKEKREAQENLGYRADIGNEEYEKLVENVLEMNRRDAKRIDQMIQYIEYNRNNPEGLEKITKFWTDFERIFREEKRERKRGKNRECNYEDPLKIKNGILGEIAAKELFTDATKYLSNQENAGEEFDFSKIGISVEESTPEEDVYKQTDFKLHISYENQVFILPVQVKCKYSQTPYTYETEFAEKNMCIFDRNGISTYEPYGKEIKRFYEPGKEEKKKKEKSGVFVILCHGYEDIIIGKDGTPSDSLKTRFYEKMKEGIYAFLQKNLSKEN